LSNSLAVTITTDRTGRIKFCFELTLSGTGWDTARKTASASGNLRKVIKYNRIFLARSNGKPKPPRRRSAYQYFLSARDYAEKKPEVLTIAMEELGTIGKWVRQNYKEAAAELAPIQGLDPDVIEVALRHYQHIYRPIDETVLTDQQKIADAFYDLGLIPKKISVRDAVLPANR